MKFSRFDISAIAHRALDYKITRTYWVGDYQFIIDDNFRNWLEKEFSPSWRNRLRKFSYKDWEKLLNVYLEVKNEEG